MKKLKKIFVILSALDTITSSSTSQFSSGISVEPAGTTRMYADPIALYNSGNARIL